MQGRKAVSLLIGGADGHPDELRRAADETWSLSSMTLQHELALVVLLEQMKNIEIKESRICFLERNYRILRSV
jgi:23S rRNA pseudoU1915 N3-methylase RlmH